MKKLKLNLNDLKIESFQTSNNKKQQLGTIQGQAYSNEATCDNYSGCTGCYDTFMTECKQGTCFGGGCVGSNEPVTCVVPECLY